MYKTREDNVREREERIKNEYAEVSKTSEKITYIEQEVAMRVGCSDRTVRNYIRRLRKPQ